MKTAKKLLALLLCVMMMMGVLVLPASAAGSYCAGDHSFRDTGVKYGNDCALGEVEYHVYVCTKCGLEYYTAIRSNGTGSGGGQHHWVDQTLPGGCGNNPGILSTCSICGMKTYKGGGSHSWGPWTGSAGSNPCTGSYTETRTCNSCGATDTRTVNAIGHDFRLSVSSTAPTCENPGVTVMECTRCHETKTTETPALGHLYQSGALCTDMRTCTRCGKTQPGVSHTLKYVNTDQGHYQTCSRCSYTTPVTKHSDSGNGYCVCGRQVGSGKCSHNWTINKKTSSFTHEEKCTLCGATRSVNCTQSTLYTPRTDCTTTEYCACGNVHKEAQQRHNFGTWRCTDSTHTHACLNIGCQYGQTPEPHTFQTVSSGLKKCTVCNYTDPKSLASHTHVWGVWTSNGSGHSHSCTVPGCSATQDLSHNLGAVNCRGEAVCKDCGATVTGRPAGSTHTGGTEIRSAKAAQVGVTGYTGDTYCLGCGKKISSGKSIPALTASHTHSYASTWSQDGTHHWKACSCGGKQDEADHTFHEGVCSVCGYKNPDYVDAKEHIHVYSADWSHNTNSHWNVCTVGGCSEVANKASHTIVNGKCTSCGFTLKDYMDEKQEEQEVESHTPVVEDKQQLIEAAVDMFKDVGTKDYYASSVGWAVQLNITNGTSSSAKTFSPNEICSQAQILTMLYRAQRGSSVADKSDMDAAVKWAAELGIIGSNFDRNAPCTRATAVTYMWKAAGSPASAAGVSFNDVSDDSAYEQAVAWAVSSGVTNGTSKSTFSPNETCNRGQIVTFLYREAVEPLK